VKERETDGLREREMKEQLWEMRESVGKKNNDSQDITKVICRRKAAICVIEGFVFINQNQGALARHF